jgi:hypothetical protein
MLVIAEIHKFVNTSDMYVFLGVGVLTLASVFATISWLVQRNIKFLGEMQGPPTGVETGNCQEF